MRYNPGDTLYILDFNVRKDATPGRSIIKIVGYPDSQSWVAIKYEDGTRDFLTTDILNKHWGLSPGAGTKLWKVLNS